MRKNTEAREVTKHKQSNKIENKCVKQRVRKKWQQLVQVVLMKQKHKKDMDKIQEM